MFNYHTYTQNTSNGNNEWLLAYSRIRLKPILFYRRAYSNVRTHTDSSIRTHIEPTHTYTQLHTHTHNNTDT